MNCEGCAGCCVDWRPLGGAPDHERRGRYRPLDDEYNLVPLTSDEIRRFCRTGLGDALTPRPFLAPDDPPNESESGGPESDETDADEADADESSDVSADESGRVVEIDGHRLAAFDGRPVYAVGLRSVPKPVAPFDGERVWLDSCVFLDPDTLQCRIHDDDRYPAACRAYPGHNLTLGTDTECERVERAHGGTRLVDDIPPEETPRRPFGPAAIGATVFAHPEPSELAGRIDRVARGETTDADRAAFVAPAAGHAPGSFAVDDERRATAHEQVVAADSWVSRAIDDWTAAVGEQSVDRGDDQRAASADERGMPAQNAPDPARVEDDRGAPSTPGWNTDN